MYKYKIKYKDGHNSISVIKIFAESEEDALSRIRDVKEVIHIKNLGKSIRLPKSLEKILHRSRLSSRELADFLRHLSYIKGAGLSLEDGLIAMSVSGTVRQVTFCNYLLSELRQGRSLADAIRTYEYLLPMTISPIIQASSDAGTLESVLLSLADQVERQIDIKSKINTALLYPAFVLVLAIGITWFLFTTIIPQIADVISTLGKGELPQMTRFVLFVGQFLKSNWSLVLLCLIAIALLFIFVVHRKGAWHSRIVLSIPLLGDILRDSEMIKFYSHFAFLLNAGFTVSEAMDSSAKIVSNKFIRQSLNKANLAVSEGYSVSDALAMNKLLRPLELQMLNIGEISGRLPDICISLSNQLSQTSDKRLQRLLKILEPSIMVIVGIIVGAIMISVYQPLFELMTAI